MGGLLLAAAYKVANYVVEFLLGKLDQRGFVLKLPVDGLDRVSHVVKVLVEAVDEVDSALGLLLAGLDDGGFVVEELPMGSWELEYAAKEVS